MLNDRNDLDDELFGEFNAHGGARRGRPTQADNAAEMRRLLNVDIGGLVFTSIQKFGARRANTPS